ncbi:transcriptional regulator [Yersinia canariae]|uniref:transcriptional regulator n=1 Tax=Yersinia canariae TaxID=2607663 RepID=UPI0021695081|nr:transcriptional regulator [Yersinia canariae]
MVKKIIIVNQSGAIGSTAKERNLTSSDRRRLKRWELSQKYNVEHGIDVGLSAEPDGTVIDLKREAENRVDKATESPSLPRDGKKEEAPPKDDIMNRVVNHAHQRIPNKKWS